MEYFVSVLYCVIQIWNIFQLMLEVHPSSITIHHINYLDRNVNYDRLINDNLVPVKITYKQKIIIGLSLIGRRNYSTRFSIKHLII